VGGGAGGCEGEQSQSGKWNVSSRSWKCGGCSWFTDSLTPLTQHVSTPLLLTLMGQPKVGRILSTSCTCTGPTYRPSSLIGRLIAISCHLLDDKFSDRKKLIEGPYRAPIYDKDN
jgi:hypothetical protein